MHLFFFCREGYARDMIDEKEVAAEKKWQSMSLSDKVGDWAYRYQYSLIMGSWATSLGVAAAIISRNKLRIRRFLSTLC